VKQQAEPGEQETGLGVVDSTASANRYDAAAADIKHYLNTFI